MQFYFIQIKQFTYFIQPVNTHRLPRVSDWSLWACKAMSVAGRDIWCNFVCSSSYLKYKYELKSDVGRIRKKWIIHFYFFGIKNYWTFHFPKFLIMKLYLWCIRTYFYYFLTLYKMLEKNIKNMQSFILSPTMFH